MQFPDKFGDDARHDGEHVPQTGRYGAVALRGDQRPAQWEDNQDQRFDDSQRLQLAAVWGAVLKHKWVIGGIIVASLLLGLAATLMMKPLYTAQTALQIDRSTPQVLPGDSNMQQTEALTGSEFMDTQIGLLKSEALARRVVQTLRLPDNNRILAIYGLNLPNAGVKLTPSQLEDTLTGIVNRSTDVHQQGLSRLVNVGFTSPDPQTSAQIANALAANFQAATLERKFESSSYARKFLEERIAQVKQKLEESEKDLVAYGAKQQIINVSPVSQGNATDTAGQSLTAADLAAANAELSEATSERIKAEERWRELQTVPILSTPEALSDPTVQTLVQQRAALSSSYQQQLKVYAPAMPEMQQLKAQIDENERQLAAVAQNIRTSVRSKFEIALKQEKSLSANVESLKGAFISLRGRNIENTILQREVDTNRTLYDGLLQRYKEVGVAGGVDTNNISVVDLARAPGGPSSPKLLLNMLVALVAGVGLAGAVTLLLELLDEAVRTPDDVTAKLGLTVLGAIPMLPKGMTPVAAMNDPRSAFSEAYSSLRTALQFVTPRGVPENILVTSGRPSEGKSTTSLALARSFANLGGSVLLVDADLRNPSLHRLVAVENNIGLSNYLAGADWEQMVRKTDQGGLSIMTSGPLPPNPAELLAGNRFTEFLRLSRQRFDLIILDGPPIIGLADGPLIASRAAATLLVIESGAARRSVLRMAMNRLHLAHGRIAGGLLTKFDAQQAGYGYGYGYGYAYAYEYGSKRIGKTAA
jgi:succinoglycan biosynthesis transport protein ExoP